MPHKIGSSFLCSSLKSFISFISFPVSDWECGYRGSDSALIEGRAFYNSFPYGVWEREIMLSFLMLGNIRQPNLVS